jgi:hypothetical protein
MNVFLYVFLFFSSFKKRKIVRLFVLFIRSSMTSVSISFVSVLSKKKTKMLFETSVTGEDETGQEIEDPYGQEEEQFDEDGIMIINAPTERERHRKRRRLENPAKQVSNSNQPFLWHVAVLKPRQVQKSDDIRDHELCFARRIAEHHVQYNNVYDLKGLAAMNYYLWQMRLSPKYDTSEKIRSQWSFVGVTHSIRPLGRDSFYDDATIVTGGGAVKVYNSWASERVLLEGKRLYLFLVRKPVSSPPPPTREKKEQKLSPPEPLDIQIEVLPPRRAGVVPPPPPPPAPPVATITTTDIKHSDTTSKYGAVLTPEQQKTIQIIQRTIPRAQTSDELRQQLQDHILMLQSTYPAPSPEAVEEASKRFNSMYTQIDSKRFSETEFNELNTLAKTVIRLQIEYRTKRKE